MSTTLHWQPCAGKDLPDELKSKLRDRYGYPINQRLNGDDVPFFEGLSACSIPGADELVRAIEKHDIVRIWEDS